MEERRFGCSDEEYRALEIARNHVISYKVLIRELELYAEELEKLGLKNEALKRKEAAGRLVKELRYWENEVRRLEKKCASGKKLNKTSYPLAF